MEITAHQGAGPPEQGGARMTIYEHLDELRSRLIRSMIAIGICTAIAFIITPFIFELLKNPVADIRLIRTEMLEMVGSYFKVALMTGVVMCLPFLLYQFVAFISPALTPQEKRYFFSLMPAFIASFLLGVAFAYFVMLPPALGFLISFQADIAEPLIKVGDYVSLVTMVMFWIGIAFELPLLLYFLSVIRVVNPWMLGRFRKYAFILAFVAAALITPTPDPVNQSIVGLPIYLLFEFGVLASRFAWRGRPRPA